MATRPYGVGPYGVGPYERYGAAVYDVAGRTSIVFGAKALRPQVTINPAAVSGIVFSLVGEFEFTWPNWAPCEPGAWPPAGPCEDGTWTTPPACGAGSWTETRLETLP